jgi:hypothetical protein
VYWRRHIALGGGLSFSEQVQVQELVVSMWDPSVTTEKVAMTARQAHSEIWAKTQVIEDATKISA